MSRTYIAIGGVTLAAAFVLVVALFGRDGRTDRASANREELTPNAPVSRAKRQRDDSAIQALLTGIEARLRRLEEPREAEPKEGEPERTPVHEDEPFEQTPEAIKALRKEAIGRLQEIDQKMELESRDNAWATGAEAEITNLFNQGSYGKTRLTGVSCRSSVCRVEAAHEDQDSSLAFEQIRRGIPGDFHMQHIDPEDDGTRRTVAYFVRPGHKEESPLYDMMYTQR
jgi:hypothetical protein